MSKVTTVIPVTTAVPVDPSVTAYQLMWAKVVTMLILGFGSFVLGIIPVKLSQLLRSKPPSPTKLHDHHHAQSSSLAVSLLLCFGGGVLLFTTFLHLQPEVRDSIDHLKASHMLPEFLVENNVNIADLIFCMGFFFVYIVEELVHVILDWKSNEQEDEAVLHRTMSLRKCCRRLSGEKCGQHGEGNGTLIPRVSLTSKPVDPDQMGVMINGSITTSTQGLLDNTQLSTITSKTKMASPLDAETRMVNVPFKTHHHHSHSHVAPSSVDIEDNVSGNTSYDTTEVVAKSFRGLLAVLALSFHEIFEGLAVGLEKSKKNVWYLFIAIATHKFVIAFCVGVELVSSKTRLSLLVVYVATFAVVTPIGIGAGIALSTYHGEASDGGLTTTLLQGMAAGTLLYVVFFEVLQRERANTQSGLLQLLAIMAGFGTMFALQFLTHHSHSHSHHGGSEALAGEDHHHFHEHHDDHDHDGHFHHH
ncbi:unnamed protein product [Bemisia tabaci]|uniref:Zinc transporter ZIP1 n=1 Tax=Bemisia tabaci TaxID=7038 RepID=A0A9P0C4J4_BEMTA|nr:unnamed protein product [Bemisia tabaci]